jgi:hypothetical protein
MDKNNVQKAKKLAKARKKAFLKSHFAREWRKIPQELPKKRPPHIFCVLSKTLIFRTKCKKGCKKSVRNPTHIHKFAQLAA